MSSMKQSIANLIETTSFVWGLIDDTYDFPHNLILFHGFMTLADVREWYDAIHLGLEFPRHDIIKGMFQKLIFQFFLILQGPRT